MSFKPLFLQPYTTPKIMSHFIEKVVTDLLAQKLDFFNTTLVLPGKRPMLFFRQEFQKQAHTILLPKMISVEDFMAEISGLEIISGINLWFKAYQSYKKVVAKPDTFEEFIKWGPTILKDFDDIDASLVNPTKILDYLVSIERIEKWGKDEIFVNKNEVMQKHLLFWQIVTKFYFQLRSDLEAEKIGYSGLAFRLAADKVDEIIESQDHQFVFAGFNALTEAEQKILFSFEKNNIAQIYWDADQYYLDNPNQEAGAFMRRYQNKVNSWKWTFDEFNQPKNINVTGVAKQVGQAKYIADIIAQMDEDEIKKTALILADEAILPAILNSLPDNISYLNISMGIPLKSVPLAQFFKSVFELQMNREKLGKGKTFYFKNVLQILENRTLSKFSTDSSREIASIIRTNNRIFNAEKTLQDHLTDNVFAPLFFVPPTLTEFVYQLKVWVENLMQHELINNGSDHQHLLLKEYLFFFKKVFIQLHENLTQVTDVKDYRTLYLLYNKIVQSESIAFIGEPLKGLQLMGLLETRLINFDNIIMTSVNDEILPLGRQNNTFIPYDIRKEMGLNTFTENDSIYAYHFYRLIQRAKNVHLVYNTEADGMGSGEKSRFIAQIKFESKHNIQETFAAPSFKTQPLKDIVIEKTPQTMSKLIAWAEYGISPSSLSTYLRDPLDFYEQRVFGIEEVEEAEEMVSAKTLGNIVHGTLEELYQPYLNKVLIEQDFDAIRKIKNDVLQKYFKAEYKDGHTDQGPNYLVYKIAERIVNGVLEKDKITASTTEFIILQLESKHEVPFLLSNGKEVKLRGIIDRIDQVDGQIRIIDYKTGFTKDIKIDSEKVNVVFEDSDKAKELQLSFYAHLFYGNPANRNREIELCIYPIKFPKKELFKLKLDKSTIIDQSIIELTTDPLSTLIEEILNPNIPFQKKEK